MQILSNVKLAHYTTFKIGGPAQFFCTVTSEEELVEAVTYAKNNNLQTFILGGGSNILMNDKGFAGLVIKIDLKGILYDGDKVSAAAGENWDDLVDETVSKGLYGLENLSAIPGSVGAAPVQNIGAYGSEVSDTISSVRAFDVSVMKFADLSNEDCKFSYRDSIFKHQKGRYIIMCVTFGLHKDHKVNVSYKEVSGYFEKNKIVGPTPEQIREAVIDIRWNKLPDWKLWGTAGSFFKNPIISAEHFNKLKQTFPDLPGFPESENEGGSLSGGNSDSSGDRVKVSLGWILDHICNFKGVCVGNVCTYEKQALVLVAKPGATSEEVVALAHQLMDLVKEKTGIQIEGEVEWVN